MSRVSQAFNDKSLRALKVEKRTSVPDPKTSGLQLRVSPANKSGRTPKVWYFNYWLKSIKKTQRIKIGSFPAIGLADARSQARLLLAEIEKGNDPALEERKHKAALTFGELAGLYMERHAKRKKTSWRDDERKLKTKGDIIPEIGHLKADDVEKHQIIDIIELIYERGSTYQSNRVLALLKTIYNWAIGEGLCKNNPAHGVKKRGTEEERDRVLSNDEIILLWNGLETSPMTPAMRIIFKLALVTGQRVGKEIGGALVSELDFTKKVWNIAKGRTKNKKPHIVPLSPEAIELFREAIELAKGSRFTFPSSTSDRALKEDDKPIEEKAPTKAFCRYKKQGFGVTDIRAHDLRSTAASNMARLGVDEKVVGKILNHTPVTVTAKHYNHHQYMEERREALQIWGAEISSLVGGI